MNTEEESNGIVSNNTDENTEERPSGAVSGRVALNNDNEHDAAIARIAEDISPTNSAQTDVESNQESAAFYRFVRTEMPPIPCAHFYRFGGTEMPPIPCARCVTAHTTSARDRASVTCERAACLPNPTSNLSRSISDPGAVDMPFSGTIPISVQRSYSSCGRLSDLESVSATIEPTIERGRVGRPNVPEASVFAAIAETEEENLSIQEIDESERAALTHYIDFDCEQEDLRSDGTNEPINIFHLDTLLNGEVREEVLQNLPVPVTDLQDVAFQSLCIDSARSPYATATCNSLGISQNGAINNQLPEQEIAAVIRPSQFATLGTFGNLQEEFVFRPPPRNTIYNFGMNEPTETEPQTELAAVVNNDNNSTEENCVYLDTSHFVVTNTFNPVVNNIPADSLDNGNGPIFCNSANTTNAPNVTNAAVNAAVSANTTIRRNSVNGANSAVRRNVANAVNGANSTNAVNNGNIGTFSTDENSARESINAFGTMIHRRLAMSTDLDNNSLRSPAQIGSVLSRNIRRSIRSSNNIQQLLSQQARIETQQHNEVMQALNNRFNRERSNRNNRYDRNN